MIFAPTLTLSAGSGAAIVRPTFSRDFAGEKTLNNGTGPAITFTRASNATFFDASGVLQTASNDAPRFDHSGGSSLGLLIEEARTNLLTYSEQFNDAAWAKVRSSIASNDVASPSGLVTADKLIEDNSATQDHFTSRLTTFSASSVSSLSVFVKAGERTRLRLVIADGNDYSNRVRADFNLTTESFSGATNSGSASGASASIVNVGGGWYRAIISGIPSITSAGFADTNISLLNDSGQVSYTGDGTSGLFIWGAQLEAGAFPTSYIPTTTAAATRSADSAVVTPISSFYNQSEGTLFGEARLARQATGFTPILFIGSGGNAVDIRYRATAATGFFVSVGSVDQAAFNGGAAISANAIARTIGAYKANSFAFSQNGEAVQTDSSGTLPSPSQLSIGTDTGSWFNGHIRKIAYYPKRLTNALLEQLTT